MAEISLFEALRTCRTVRRLRPDPVPDELLRKILTAATWAPSGGNRQPWRFLVVRDAERKRQLRELYLPLWRTFSQAYTAHLSGLPAEARARQERMVGSADHLAEHFHEAPVIVVVCVHIPELACRAVGLGAALTTLLCQKEPEVRALLDIPVGWATCAHLALGFPEGAGHGPVRRKPVERVAFLDRWEQPLFPVS